jgi:hypothetical protein
MRTFYQFVNSKKRRNGLARIIKTGSAGKNRLLLEKGIVIAIRELAKQTSTDKTTNDLVAFIAISLIAIGDTIDESVVAWEKRGYWVKADKYRMEWSWTTRMGEDLKNAAINDDWGKVAQITAQVAQKMSKVNVSPRNRLGTPWVGSWERLIRPN